MDTSSATPQPLPRLRVSRVSPSGRLDNNNTSVSSSQAGPSRLTDFTQLVDLNLSDIRASHNYTDEDEAEDQHPTPRMNSATPLAASSTTSGASLAGRLRELIHLVPNGSGSQGTPTPRRPPSPTFHESDFEGESTAGHSRARESLRDIFSKALREPGDTPRKGVQRRNSDSSIGEIEPNPASSTKWSDIKGKQKSLSDEESDNPARTHINGPSQHTILRSSRDTNAIEFPLKSISADDSDDAEDSPKPRRVNPLNATSTPLQSLRISQNSSFPQHSNLLDQDSEMQRAFGELDSFDEPTAHLQKHREPNVRQTTETNASAVTPDALGKLAATHTPRLTKKNLDSHTSSSRLGYPSSASKPTLLKEARNSIREERNVNVNGRERGERRTSLQGPPTPSLKHKSSSSLQFSDHSSAMSASDYGERIREVERERNREREREWNRPHPKNIRPGSSLSFHSPRPDPRSRTPSISSLESARPGSAFSNISMDSADSPRAKMRTTSELNERPRKQSLSGSDRPGSALSNHSASIPDFPQGLRRHHSLTSRADSPASSKSTSSQDGGSRALVELERERNWNAPRPKWHRRSLPNTPNRPASPGPSKLSSPRSPPDHRREPAVSPTALKDTSNTSRSEVRSSLNRRHSLQSKAAPPSPSPTERRNGSSMSSTKSPHSSRLSTVVASTPARPRSPLPRPGSQKESRLPLSSNRSHNSRFETPNAIPDIQVQNEAGKTQSTVSFPQAANGGSLSQESMELTEAYNAQEATLVLPSFSDSDLHIPTPNNNTMHTASLLGPDGSRATMNGTYDDDADDDLAQERTPTLQTISPPLEETQVQEVWEPLSTMDQTHENFVSTSEELAPSSPGFQPMDADPSSIPSFLSTPPRPRQSSFSSSKLEFQTPSPPKTLPELPGPPSSESGDETDYDSVPQFNITPAPIESTPADKIRSGNGNGDLTTFKTPKPPGAWFATPGPPLEPVTQENSTNGFVDSSDDGLLKARPSHSKSIFPQTPAPPGGWMNTPAGRQRAQSDPQSILNEGGLTTPVPSLGRASTMPLKTPAPPGAWANTPAAGAARKSVLKVRFDSDVANESSDVLPDSIVGHTNGSSTVSEPVHGAVRSTTPEPVTPTTPPSRSPRKHKRSPSVRMVDAYGNEQREDRVRKRDAPSPTPTTPRNKSGIRIVDALGQEVKEEPEPPIEVVEEDTVGPSQVTPMSRVEALQRVRQGILELAEGIESLDLISSSPQENDNARIKALDETSRALKQSREQLSQDMHRAEKELRRQVRQKALANIWLGRNVWFLFFVGVLQVVLIFIMYRASVLRAKKMFLTNYYDPFNPDLFLYTTNPDTQYATATTSWNLVTQAARSGDLTAFTGAFRDNLSLLIKRWHQQIWDVWGDDPNRPVGAWPPT